MVTVTQLQGRIGLDDRSFVAGLNRSGQRMTRFAHGVNSHASSIMGAFGGMTLAITGGFGGSIGEATKFQKKIVEIGGNTTLTSANLKQLGIDAKAMASQTGANVYDVADAFMHATNLSFSFADSQKIVHAALESALSSGAKVADVTRTLAQVMRESGAPMSHVTAIMDALHVASANSTVKMEDFAHSGARAFGIMGAMGLSTKETGVILATLTKHGFPNAGQAATQYAGMISKITGPSKGAQKEIARLSKTTGIDLVKDFTQAGLKQKGVIGVLEDLKKATHGNYTEIQKLIPATRGGLGVFALLNQGMGDLHQTMDKVNKSYGSTATAFARQQASTAAQMSKFDENIRVLAINMGTTLLPVVNKVLQIGIKLSSWFNGLSPDTQRIVTDFVAFAGVGVALVGVLGKIMLFVSDLAGAWTELTGAAGEAAIAETGVAESGGGLAAVLGGPVTLVIAGVVAAIAALAFAWSHDWGHIREVVQNVIDWLRPYLLDAIGAVKSLWMSLMGQIVTWTQQNMPLIQATWKVISTAVSTYVTSIGAVITAVIGPLIGFIQAHMTQIKAIFSIVWGSVVRLVHLAVGTVLNVLKLGMELITGDWRGAWTTIKNIARDLLGEIVQEFKDGVALFKNIGEMIMSGLEDGIKSGASAVGSAVKGEVKSIIGDAKSLLGIASPSRVFSRIGEDTMDGMRHGIKKGAKHVKTELQKEILAFARAMASAKSQLVEAQHGGTQDDQKLASRFRLISQGRRDELASIMKSTEAIKEEKRERISYGRAIDELQKKIRLARATGPDAEVRARFPSLPAGQIKTLVNYQATLDAVKAKTRAMADSQRQAKEAVTQARNAFLRASAATDVEKIALDEFNRPLKELPAALQKAAESISDYRIKTEELQAAQKKAHSEKTQHDSITAGLNKHIEETQARIAALSGTTTDHDKAVDAARQQYDKLDATQRGLAKTLYALQDRLRNLTAEHKAAAAAAKAYQSVTEKLRAKLAEIQVKTAELTRTHVEENVVMQAMRITYANLDVSQKKLADQVMASVDAYNKQKAAMAAARLESQKEASFTKALQNQLAQLSGRINEATHGLSKHDMQLRQVGFDTSKYTDQLKNMTAEQKKLVDQINQSYQTLQDKTDFQDNMRQIVTGVSDLFTKCFHDLFTGGFGKFFTNVTQGFEQMLEKMAEDYLKSQVKDLITKGLGSLFGADLSGSGGGSLAMPFGGARAAGGPVSPASAYMVGERGPEMFVPRSAGSIVPSGGASVINQTIHINTPDVAGFKRAQGQIAAETYAYIARAARRNG